MTQEDKELLLKDLCARLPYHIRCKIWLKDGTTEEGLLDLEHNYGNVLQDAFYYNKIKDIKSYLRPMSSMTEEEKQELERLSEEYFGKALDKQIQESLSSSNKNESRILEYIASSVIIDWLNKHHFDYRGLIEKGLAIEALEGMYK